ncbi:MAG: hypothetical protein HYW49_08410 [Deltaproteobacteria bacterium]|nr:hypothetical protein [Deltaproteobacteria bacterium]
MWKKIALLFFFFQVIYFSPMQSIHAAAPNESVFCSKNIEKKFGKKFGNYRIRISYANERMCQHLDIFKQDKVAFHEEGIDNHYDLESKWPGHGTQMAVSKWTGGAHCCMSLLIFELGDKFRKIADIYGGNFDPEIIDLDHDGIPEIQITDDFLAYRFSSFASSAKGSVILKYSNGEYFLAEEMMKHAPPSESSLKKRIPAWRKEFLEHGPDWPPESFIQTLTDLVFTGNGDRASEFVDQVWPKDLAGKEEFVKSYKEALSESRYYSKAAAHIF